MAVEWPGGRCGLELSPARIEAAGGVVRFGGLEIDAELMDGATLRIQGATDVPPGALVTPVFVPPERKAT